MVTTHKMDIFITEVDLWSTDIDLSCYFWLFCDGDCCENIWWNGQKGPTFAPTIVIAEKTNTNTFKE